MEKCTEIQVLADLLCEAYQSVVFVPDDQERDLLRRTGSERPEVQMEICRQVFGENVYAAFQAVAIHVMDHCEYLLNHMNEWSAKPDTDRIVEETEKAVQAIEWLEKSIPFDDLYQKAYIASCAHNARTCFYSVCQRMAEKTKKR